MNQPTPSPKTAKRLAKEYYFEATTPALKLAKLEELERLPASLKKHLKYEGVLLNISQARVTQHWELAVSAFAEADQRYWRLHDPAEPPEMSRHYVWSYGVRHAVERAAKAAFVANKRPTTFDFSVARTSASFVVEHGRGELLAAARIMLGWIALREGKAREAIACCASFPKGHDTVLLLWAYQALNQRAKLVKLLEQSEYGTHRAFLAELNGEDERAVQFYLEAIQEDRWSVDYAKARLRTLERRLGKATIERLRRSQLRKTDSEKLVIGSVADFHARFAEIAAAIRKEQNITEAPRPMSEAEFAKLRLPTLRQNARPVVAVPPSVATVLRFDRNFRLRKLTPPLLARLKPVNIERLLRSQLRGEDTGLGQLSKLPANIPLWNDDTAMPACISISNGGDQKLFLYMGVPDSDGEYPVARFDDQPEIWVSEASLIQLILEAAPKTLTHQLDFASAKKRAQNRNRAFREGWSHHPDVRAILARY